MAEIADMVGIIEIHEITETMDTERGLEIGQDPEVKINHFEDI